MYNLEELTLEVTNQCVQECIHCSSKSCFRDTTSIALEKCKEVIDECIEMGLKTLNISGGEPFLYKDLVHLVEFVKSKNIAVNIYSCGIIGVPGDYSSIPLKSYLKLKDAGVNKIIFSLHGVNSMYTRMTRVINGFKYMNESLLNAKKSGNNIEVHFVPTSINIDDFENVVDYIYNIGIYKISILRLVPQGRATQCMVPNYARMVDFLKVDERLKNKYPKLQIRKGHPLRIYHCDNCGGECTAGKTKLVIMANGMIIPCEAYKWMAYE